MNNIIKNIYTHFSSHSDMFSRILGVLVLMFAMIIGAGNAWSQTVVATWDWQGGIPSGISIDNSGRVETLASNVAGIELGVDATNGMLKNNGNNVCMNSGTILSVPVQSANDVVYVKNYHTYSDYTVGGQQPVNDRVVHFVTEEEATAGKVLIEATKQVYFFTITVVQNKNVPEAYTAVWDWNHQNPSSLTSTSFQNSFGPLVSSVAGVPLIVDAVGADANSNADNGGKLQYNSGGHVQINSATNNGTILYVPVQKTGDVIKMKFHSYDSSWTRTKVNGGSACTVEKEDGLDVFTYIATSEDAQNGYMYIETTGIVYLYSISLESKAAFRDFEIIVNNQSGTLLNGSEQVQGTNVSFGVAVGEDGAVSRVAADASSRIATVSGKYHSNHGMNNFKMVVPVPGPVKITVGTCTYGNTPLQVKDSDGKTYSLASAAGDGSTNTCWQSNHTNIISGIYEGAATTLEITAGTYVPYIKVERYEAPEQPAAPQIEVPDGIYDAVVSDVDGLKRALAAASGTSRYKIFICDGTYDLGTVYDTRVKTKTTLVGQSRDGVIIKNHPTTEGIWTSATLRTGSDVIMQNLTLKCTVDYVGGAERGTALYDDGSNNVYRNICLLGRQDTYYSSDATNSYFENCEIHGTVDFICGSGNAWFEKCTLLVENRSSDNVIVAPRNSSSGEYKGYFFNNCTIDNAAGANMDGKYYLGRGWSGTPKSVFAHCTYKITPKGSDGYSRDSWADGGAAVKDNSGMTKQDAALTNCASVMGAAATVASGIPSAPANVKSDGNTITWDAVQGASYYAVYKNNSITAFVTECSYDIESQSSVKGAPRLNSEGKDVYSVAAITSEGVIGEAEQVEEEEPEPVLPSGFNDFTIDLTKNPVGALPAGVTQISYPKNGVSFNGSQHGWCWYAIQFAVDGPVKISVGGCQYINTGCEAYLTDADGNKIADINNKTAKCFDADGSCGTYIYSGEAQTLKLYCGQYCPYVKVEKIKPANFTIDLTKNPVGALPEGVTQITHPGHGAGYNGAQHGWMWYGVKFAVPGATRIAIKGCQYAAAESAYITDSKGTKLATLDTKSVGCDGYAVYYYSGKPDELYVYCGQYSPELKVNSMNYSIDLTKSQPELPEGVTQISYSQHGAGYNGAQHGWKWYAIEFPVAGNADITVGGCQYINDGCEAYLTDVSGNKIADLPNKAVGCSGSYTYHYKGAAATLRLYCGKYCPYINIVNVGAPARTFKDFKIDLQTNPYSMMDGTELPAGARVGGSYNGAQHGYTNPTIVVPVDGPVKFTLGSCQYGGHTITVKDKNGAVIGSIDNNNGCDNANQKTKYVEWRYNAEEENILTFEVKGYMPFFYAEACEFVPDITITYYNGSDKIGEELKPGNYTVDGFNETFTAAVPVPDGYRFRGWRDEKGLKVDGKTYTSDLNLYAVVTPIEVTAPSTTFTYDLTKQNFYPEDHDCIDIQGDGMKFHDSQHGWSTVDGGVISVPVSGNAKITLGLCMYGSGNIEIRDENGTQICPNISGKASTDGAAYEVEYTGPATTLHIKFNGNSYLHNIVVKNESLFNLKFAQTKDKVIVTNGNSGTRVYYTLDGSEPTTSNYADGSSLPSIEIPITQNTWVKAICVNSNGETIDQVSMYCRLSFIGFTWDFSAGSTLLGDSKESVNTGVIIDDNGGTYLVDKGNPSSSIDIDTKWHDGQHGYLGINAKVPVDGPVIIKIGECYYNNGSITITDSKGKFSQTIDRLNDKRTCYNSSKESLTFEYNGGPTILTISSTGTMYIPYLSVKDATIVKVKFVNRYSSTLHGTVPPETEVNELRKAYIPENNTLYREGWAVTGWTDGTNVFPLNSWQEFLENTTLYPVLTKSEKTVADSDSPVEVTWPFDHTEAPAICINNTSSDPTEMTYVKCVSVEDSKVDVPLVLSAAKADNTDSRVNALNNGTPEAPEAKGGQLNDGIVMTIPAVPGMVITLQASDKQEDARYGGSQTRFEDGNAKVMVGDEVWTNITNSGKTISYTYTGDATSVAITLPKTNAGTSWGFFEYLKVTYPVLPDVVIENSIVTTPLYANEKPANAGVATASATTHPNTGSRYSAGDNVTITATAAYGYYISGIKNGDASLTMTKVEPDAGSAQPTKVTATYEVKAVEGSSNANNTITVEYTRLPMVHIAITSSDPEQGTVDVSPKYDNFYSRSADGGKVDAYYLSGTTVKAISEAAMDYVLEKWATSDGTQLAESNDYSVALTSDREIVAYFKQGELGSVIFTFTGAEKTDGVYDDLTRTFTTAGVAIESGSILPDNVSGQRSFIIPESYPIYFKGYSLIRWEDESGNQYDLGRYYSFRNADETKTLHPVFEKVYSLFENRTNAPLYHYEFGTGAKAQKVDIDKATNTFWTTHVHVESIFGNTEYSQERDAALFVNTSGGYMANGDLPDWAAFGEGTTFEIPSCPGATISLLAYAPITSTTIDGVVPTLDKDASDIANHQYVYRYTTRSSADRVKVVIGDDFSYYKWIESQTLESSLVDLHVNVADDVHGKVKAIVATNANFPAVELEDGGVSFVMNNEAKITFQRFFGFELDYIEDPDRGIHVIDMLPDNKVSMITTKEGNGNPEEVSYDEGTHSWHNSLFTLVKREVAGERTNYDLSFNITTDRRLIIHFKDKPTYYVTYNTGKLASGTAPAAEWLEQGDTYVIPKNNTLYYEGHTLKKWEDEEGSQYAINQTCTLTVASDKRLFPVFEKNSFSILDVETETKAVWPIILDDGAPVINYERSKGILVTQLHKGGDFIDLKAELDGTEWLDSNGQWQYENGSVIAGKFNNTAYTNRCQINVHSKLTFPAAPGCEIHLAAQNAIGPSTDKNGNAIPCTKIAGQSDYSAGTDVKVTYPEDNSAKQELIEFADDGRFYTKFDVTYVPVTTNKPTLTAVSYGSTPVSGQSWTNLTTNKEVTLTIAANTTDDTLPAVTATAENGVVEILQPTINNRQAVLALKTTGGVLVETYLVNFTVTPPATAPAFSHFIVNGTDYANGATVSNAPSNGIIKVQFNRTMKETSFEAEGTTYSAGQGKVLEFNYWGKSGTFTFTIPANTLSDVYDVPFTSALTLTLNIVSGSNAYAHRAFDAVVGYTPDVETLDKAITLANAHDPSQRYYIFVPDGEYELTGNENITLKNSLVGDPTTLYNDKGEYLSDYLGKTFNNHKTQISKAKVSLIGQSNEGVQIYNHPIIEGIGYTATLHIPSSAADFYAEDLTLENRYDYWGAMSNSSNSAARAVVLQGHGNRTVMKNVSLYSYQDTYYSSNEKGDFRGYFENCTFAGVVDWICGGGDVWWEKCNIMLRDRSGNNIAAPHTTKSQQWGYIFNDCAVTLESEEMEQLRGKDWSLARPWGGMDGLSPACTFLNTTIHSMPRDAGWGIMNGGMVLRFHEYKTKDANGNLVSLGTRSLAACAPAAGSDDLILSDAEAAEYTITNALGGSDAFNPKDRTQQINAQTGDGFSSSLDPEDEEWNDDIQLLDGELLWNNCEKALCYFVFRKDDEGKWRYVDNVAQDDGSTTSFNLEQYDEGEYYVRAANQYGGLGSPTRTITYKRAERYTLKLAAAEKDGQTTTQGWSTICLPYNAKAPEGIKVYAAVDATGNTIILKSVSYITAEVGYVVYGTPGSYVFKQSSRDAHYSLGEAQESFLSGNPSYVSISASNTNCYTLAFKPAISGIGFYKFTGDYLAANRAWLDVDTFNAHNGDESVSSAKGIRFILLDEDGVATGITSHQSSIPSLIYDLQGRVVRTPLPGRIYIINGEKTLWE